MIMLANKRLYFNLFLILVLTKKKRKYIFPGWFLRYNGNAGFVIWGEWSLSLPFNLVTLFWREWQITLPKIKIWICSFYIGEYYHAPKTWMRRSIFHYSACKFVMSLPLLIANVMEKVDDGMHRKKIRIILLQRWHSC